MVMESQKVACKIHQKWQTWKNVK